MKKVIGLIFLPISLVVLNELSYSQVIPADSLSKSSLKFIESIRSNDLDHASKLFHYPSSYTKDELFDDIKNVHQSLKVLLDEFGTILDSEIADSSGSVYHISIGGGDLSYWQKYPKSYQMIYSTKFKKDGQGYLIFNFCNIGGKWEIRDVQYCLPASKPDSQKRIAEITLKMLTQLMKEEKPR